MGVEAVIATQVIDTTTVGRSLMTAADAAAARTALSLGTLATQNGTFSGTHSGTSSGTNTGDQDLSSYLTSAAAAAAYQVILVSGTNIKTINGSSLLGSGDVTISGLSGTGSVDNAILRADGTGGATLQNSALTIADLATASPNNTVNVVSMAPTGGTTNVGIAVVPKGTGSFSLAVPDSGAGGGNARGDNAVDLQTLRGSAAQVASGSAAIAFNQRCTASGRSAIAGGYQSVASGQFEPVAIGKFATASGTEGSVAIGPETVASASYTNAFGFGSTASRHGQQSYAGGYFAAAGDAQSVRFVVRHKTTSTTPVTLMLDGSATRLTITSGKILFATVRISGIKSDGSAACCYQRKIAIKNVGGTTALVGTVETIGTDIEDAAGCDVTITADNTNDAIDISVTGIAAETWRWVAVVEGLEIAYGT